MHNSSIESRLELVRFHSFNPDLLVEVTSVCDRQCVGCYAPNLVTKESPEDLLQKYPNFFLSDETFKTSLEALKGLFTTKRKVLAFRGGEPSKHPKLASLVGIAADHGFIIYIETHGRWITADSMLNSKLLSQIAAADAYVKISYDQMHGLSVSQLETITGVLTRRGIRWFVAITEDSINKVFQTRAYCDFIPDEQVILQHKASTSDELIRPNWGVLTVTGQFRASVTHKLKTQTNLNLLDAISEASVMEV